MDELADFHDERGKAGDIYNLFGSTSGYGPRNR